MSTEGERQAAARRRGMVILSVIVLVMGSAHLYQGVKQYGVSVTGILPSLLGLVLVVGIVGAVFRWTSKDPGVVTRNGKLFAALGIGGAALSGLASVLGAAANASSSGDPTFHVDGRRMTSRALKLALTMPESWTHLDVPAQAGVDGLFKEDGSNTVLGGYVIADGQHDVNLESTLDRMLDERRRKWGELQNIRWDDDSFGGLEWKTLSFSMTGPNGPVRNKLWVSKKGSSVVGFNCSGAVPTFEASARLCADAIHRLENR